MTILVSAHDAGGANQLLYRFLESAGVEFVLTGPASRIASELGIKHSQAFDFDSIGNYSRIYVGSNSANQLSDLILSEALKLKISTTGVLEHWVNFEQRWDLLPDLIEVQDFRAFLGGLYYFKYKVRLRKNFYLEHLKENFVEQIGSQSTLLVVLQPMPGGFNHEIDNCFCSNVLKLINRFPHIQKIILRQHVETDASICLIFLSQKLAVPVSIAEIYSSLQTDISCAKFVLGLDSYAMYVARQLGRKVFTISRSRRSKFAPKYKYLD